ncbi:MAG: DUF4143 domain-containing protein [Spirochaetales bacterium]|nr:DUF4143 domain-containing protein [Spirochaetales bacterium]
MNFVNRGTLAEQFIGQELYHLSPSYREPELFYWTRESRGASAEVDYLITDGHGKIIPVEVKYRLLSLPHYLVQQVDRLLQ